jgi:hypothetical protein
MSERRLRSIAVLLVAWAVLWAPPVAAQNEEPEKEEGGLEDFFKGVAEDFLEDQLGGQLGRIRSVEVLAEQESSVVLRASLEDVTDPVGARVEAELFDQKMGSVTGVAVEHDPLPEGSGAVKVRVTYTGTGTLYSSALKLSLVDSEGGRASSHRRIKLVHRWTGTDAAGDDEAAVAESEELTVRSDEKLEEREPQTVDVKPARVGDTPARGQATAPSSPATVTVAQPMVMRKDATRATAPKTTATMSRSTVKLPSSIDLYRMAPNATWASTSGALSFGGATSDRRGFARALNQAVMNDGSTHQKVLQTHPPWVSAGTITGRYEIHMPASATRFDAKIGFLKGVSSSDGVNVKVSLKGAQRVKDLAARRLHPSQGVVAFSAQIPEDWRDQDVTVMLIVQAGRTSTQDWFAWIAPTIR